MNSRIFQTRGVKFCERYLFSKCKVLLWQPTQMMKLLARRNYTSAIRRAGCDARAIVLGEGMTSRDRHRNPDSWKEQLQKHKLNFKRATERVGYNSAKLYDLPDNRFDNVDLLDVIKIIEEEIRIYEPDIVFCHHPKDLNVDHRVSMKQLSRRHVQCQRAWHQMCLPLRPYLQQNGRCLSKILGFSQIFRYALSPRHFCEAASSGRLRHRD